MWYILDKAKKRIGVMNTNSPNGLPVLSDSHTAKIENGYTDLTFTIPSNHTKSALLQEEGFIVYTDGKRDFELFKIHEIEESYGDEVSKTVHCQAASTMELTRSNRIRPKKFTSETLENIMTYLSGNSGWRIGESYYDTLITIEFSNYETAKEAIQATIAQAEAEIEYKVVFDGNKIADKVINLYDAKTRGKKTNVLVEYGLNLKGFTRKVNTDNMITAMIGDGGEDANGKKISIVDAKWTPTEDGFELLDDMVVDNNALEEWFPEGVHAQGLFSDENAQNPVELAQNTLAELKKYNKPDITYEIDFAVLENLTGYSHLEINLGDTIMVKDTTFSEPKYINARVIEIENSTVNPEEGKIVLAEYVLLKPDPIASIQRTQAIINIKEKQWNATKAKADAALETVNEVKEQIVYKAELQTTKGTVFRNGVINTQLIAVAFKGKEDITTTLPNTSIVWTKYDMDGNIDTAWNTAHANTGRILTLTQNDIYKKATIKCEILIDSKPVASITATLIDINDGVISGLAPQNPTQDFLWIDTSVTPNMLKKWSNNAWVNLGQLDPLMSQTIGAIQQTLNDMASDSIIDYKERQMIKDDLTKVIGFVISDTQMYLPATSTLDSSAKGEFYNVRKGATIAGISTSDAKYVDVATKYNDLKSYLEGLLPVRAWDISTVNQNLNITVEKATWRDKWLQYRLAVAALDEATTTQTKANTDNIQIGWRNVIRNSTFNKTDANGNLVSWTNVNSYWSLVDVPESDKPNSNILRCTASGNTTNPLYSLYSNFFNVKKGDIWTVTLDLKVGSFSGWDTKIPFILEFYDSTGTKVESKNVTNTDLKLTTMTDNTWYRPAFTYTVTTTGVTTGRIRPLLYKNGDLYIREVQAERGTKPTDYKEAVEDSQEQIAIVEARVSDIEQATSSDAIISTVTQSTQYAMDLSSKADAESLGNYATSDELNDAVSAVNSNTDQKIASIDFTPFAQKSDLSQTASDITAKFQSGGGINQLRNSVGFSSGDFWTSTGTVQTIQNDELAQLGFNSGFYSPSGSFVTLSQNVYTIVGQVYSFSYYLKKVGDSGTNGYARVDILDQLGIVAQTIGYATNAGVTNGYQRLTVTFTATTPIHTVKFTVGSGTDAIGTGFMFNIGEIPLQWSSHSSELYNTNIKMDLNGIQVSHYDNGIVQSKTKMTPDTFAGFYDNNGDGVIDETPNSVDEVFRMDRDEFVMKKTVAKEEITMGTVKIVKIASSSKNGWAFVSNLEG
ncbi:phage tail protein [Priestia aryabhattai]|uniref:phage tail spike protein n=1 Tax=Priestia aryabhattai TaxID=412384 RepID=UPI001ECF8607|nr:phage tail spike protein [Priestia aryabhattai]MBY0094949.1 phage tail protein [Priestia aryabhattai]MBY0105610.1 phage tail protein [Priestia aryabhattai]